MAHSTEEMRYAYLAKALFERIDSPKGRALAYATLAQIHERNFQMNQKQKTDSALLYIMKSDRLYRTVNDTLGIADSQLKLGELYANRNNPKAHYHLKEALKWLEYRPNLRTQFNATLQLGTSYLNSNQPDSAWIYLSRASQFYESNQLDDHLLSVNLDQAIIGYYEKTGQWQQAYKRQAALFARENQRFSKERDEAIIRLQVQHDIFRKESDLKAKALELNLTNTALRQQQWFAIITFILFSGAALLSFFLFRLYRKYQRTSHQNNLLLREHLHRSKNNLQQIMSILSIQGSLLSDPLSRQVVEESRQRVQSMTFIQGRIFNETDAEVEIHTLIPEIVKGILYSYGHDRSIAKFSLSPSKLNKDQTLCLGLIITELVTNACKYAFASHDNPRLGIFFEEQSGHIRLVVSDNGPGFGPHWDRSTPAYSLGMTLIRLQIEQLGGSYDFQNDEGVKFSMTFKAE